MERLFLLVVIFTRVNFSIAIGKSFSCRGLHAQLPFVHEVFKRVSID